MPEGRDTEVITGDRAPTCPRGPRVLPGSIVIPDGRFSDLPVKELTPQKIKYRHGSWLMERTVLAEDACNPPPSHRRLWKCAGRAMQCVSARGMDIAWARRRRAPGPGRSWEPRGHNTSGSADVVAVHKPRAGRGKPEADGDGETPEATRSRSTSGAGVTDAEKTHISKWLQSVHKKNGRTSAAFKWAALRRRGATTRSRRCPRSPATRATRPLASTSPGHR